MKLICFLALIACATANAAPFTFQSWEHQTALLELYTSEGCSSCPPAEAWLSKVKSGPSPKGITGRRALAVWITRSGHLEPLHATGGRLPVPDKN